ncbi:MAG: replication factor C large subunit, partial [Candidatus Aenigmatarchaeota archaeon]
MGWVEKYAPKKLNEIIGQSKAISQFLEWYEKWKPGDKAAMFYGQTGRGKTALVYAFANEKGLDVVEVNASDWRNKDVIEEVLGRASKQMSLFRRGKIILVDEVDGIAGREDRGGVGALIKVIKESKFPIVLTANDPYDKKLAQLRQYV